MIVVRDGVGFYTSRILGPYMNEAGFMVEEGYALESEVGLLRRYEP